MASPDIKTAPAAASKSDEVLARRVTFVNTGVVYSSKSGERKHAEAGGDIADMCDADLAHFKSIGAIETKLVEA